MKNELEYQQSQNCVDAISLAVKNYIARTGKRRDLIDIMHMPFWANDRYYAAQIFGLIWRRQHWRIKYVHWLEIESSRYWDLVDQMNFELKTND